MWGIEVDFKDKFGAGTFGEDNIEEPKIKKKKNEIEDLGWEASIIIGAVLTIFLIVVDKVYDLGGYSNHNRGMIEVHRFSTKSMVALALVRLFMFAFLLKGYSKRLGLY